MYASKPCGAGAARLRTYVRTWRGVDWYARVVMASTFPCPIEYPISHPTESLLLHDAAAKGHLDTTKLLVKKKGQGPNDSDKDGNAPLHHAAFNGRLETVAFLAKHSDPDIRGNLGWTPLHFACLEGHLEVAKHLVEVCRASVSAEDEKGRNAAHFAACSGNLELIRFLAREKGLEAGQQCHSGCTALHYAAYRGHLEVIRFLSERRENILSTDKRGNTALHYSAIAGHADAVELFTSEFNCDPNLQNADGDSPLHIACRESHLEVVRVLATHRNINRALKNEVGLTPRESATVGAVIEALQDSKPSTTVEEPPVKKPRLDGITPTGLHSSGGNSEPFPLSSGLEGHSQTLSNTESSLTAGSVNVDNSTHKERVMQNQQNTSENEIEPTQESQDPMEPAEEEESNEASLSLAMSKCQFITTITKG